MHALSVKQPYAEQIASGAKRAEFRTWAPRVLVGRDLLIVASRTAERGGEGLPIGVAICVVRVDAMTPHARWGYAWKLSDPRRVAPLALRGSAALYLVDDDRLTFDASAPRIVPPPPRSAPRVRGRVSSAAHGPYSLRVGDGSKTIERGIETPALARLRAELHAAERREIVYIWRDGCEVSQARPA